MIRNLAFGSKSLHQQLIEPSDGVPVHIAEIIPRRIFFIRFKLDAPWLTGTRNRGFPRTLTARRTHPYAEAVQSLQKLRLRDAYMDRIFGHRRSFRAECAIFEMMLLGSIPSASAAKFN